VGARHGGIVRRVKLVGVKFDFAAAMLARARDVTRMRQPLRYFVFRHKSFHEH
jgi:hypothetical protein